MRKHFAWKLVAELQWFGDIFRGLVPTLDKWTDMLMAALGIIAEDRKEFDKRFEDMVPDIRREQLVALKSRLEKIGIEVPPPEGAA